MKRKIIESTKWILILYIVLLIGTSVEAKADSVDEAGSDNIFKIFIESIQDTDHPERIVIQSESKYGIADLNGKIIAPCEWDSIGTYSEGLFIAEKNCKRYFINETGDVVIPFEWNYAAGFSDGRALIGLNGKQGYIDRTGKIIIPPEWEYSYSFREGLASVSKDGKHGFIDLDGQIVIPLQYDSASSFHDGYALIADAEGYNYIDHSGKYLLKESVQYASDFTDGTAFVWQDNLVGLINKSGEWIVPCEKDVILFYFDGIAVVHEHGSYGKYGYMNDKGELIVPYAINGWAFSFREERAIIEDHDVWLCLDTEGKVVFPLEELFPREIQFQDGFLIVTDRVQDTYGLIDRNGNRMIPCEYEQIIRKGDRFFILKDGKVQMIKLTDMQESDPTYPSFYHWKTDKGNYIACFNKDGSFLVQRYSDPWFLINTWKYWP